MADGKHKYTLLQFQERLIDIIENVFGKDLDAKDTSQNKGWGLLGPGGAAGPFGKRVRKKNKPRFVQTAQQKNCWGEAFLWTDVR